MTGVIGMIGVIGMNGVIGMTGVTVRTGMTVTGIENPMREDKGYAFWKTGKF